MLRNTLATLAASTFFSLAAQQTPEGLEATTAALPVQAGNLLETALGIVYFDGTELVLAMNGQPPQALLTLPGPVFGSFTIQAGPGHVLFGESSNGDIWLVPLNGPMPAQPIANLPFNYDAVLRSPTSALISAKTGGFSSPDNDILLLDLTTGQKQTIAQFPGASGPVAANSSGDLYYATASAAFPSPPGATSILRLTDAVIVSAVALGTVLGPAHADLVFAGLDAAGDLALDDDGDLFFTDYVNNQVGELNNVDGAQPSLAPPLIDYSLASVGSSSLQFVPATTPAGGVFEPFQPAGGRLVVHETDYFSQSQVRSLTARRATLAATVAAPIPTGAFDLVTTDGPSNGIGLVGFAPVGPNGEISIAVPGFEAPLPWAASLTSNPVLVPVVFDAAGRATLTVVNPGFSPGFDATAQVLLISALGALGSTQVLGLQIGQ